MPLNHTFNFEYPLKFCTRSVFFPDFFLDFFPEFFLDFFLDNFSIFSDFFLYFLLEFFPDFLPEFFPDFLPKFFSRLFSQLFSWFFLIFLPAFSRLSVEGGSPQSSYCCGLGEHCGLISLLKREIFSHQWDIEMTSTFAVLLILTLALKTSTCDGVRPANYIPTLQEYPLNVMT